MKPYPKSLECPRRFYADRIQFTFFRWMPTLSASIVLNKTRHVRTAPRPEPPSSSNEESLQVHLVNLM